MLHDEETPGCWRITLTGRPDPLALARTLQKVSAPTIRLCAASFLDRDDDVWMALTLRCTPARARLVHARMQKLAWVDSCDLRGEQAPEPHSFCKQSFG